MQGLHRLCAQMLAQPDHANNSSLRQWLCFCIAKQCENFPWAKNVLLSENIHAHLEPFVTNDASPEVRAAAVYALGNFSGAFVQVGEASGLGVPPADPQADVHFRHAEMRVIMCILPACHDGSPLVRREAVIALAHFIFDRRHFPLFKAVAAHLITRHQGSEQTEHPSTAAAAADVVEADSASDPDSRQSSTASAPAASTRYNFAQHFADERTQGLRATLLGMLGEHGAKLAESYYTVWLTLREMQFGDPHPAVVESVTAIARLMHEQVVRNANQHNRQPTSTRDDSLRGPSNHQDAQTIRNVQSYADLQQHNRVDATAHVQARPQPNRALSPRATTLGGPRMAAPRPTMGQPPTTMGSQPAPQQGKRSSCRM
jgi:regulator-associated protein of mTOR